MTILQVDLPSPRHNEFLEPDFHVKSGSRSFIPADLLKNMARLPCFFMDFL